MKTSKVFLLACMFALVASPVLADYTSTVIADSPVAYWRMSETESVEWMPTTVSNSGTAGSMLDGFSEGGVAFDVAGPTTSGFSSTNSAVAFDRTLVSHAIRILDPGTDSVLDFGAGDSMTIEFWVKPDYTTYGYQTYVVGKGRDESGATDQNYALRITPATGAISSLFRLDDDSAWAQWTTPALNMFDDKWHHIAYTQTFGDNSEGSGSASLYFDGYDLSDLMTWSFSGTPATSVVSAQDAAPIQSNGDLLLGYNPSRGNFNGGLDEVAIYGEALSLETIQSHVTSAGISVLTEPPTAPVLPSPSESVFNGDFELPVTVMTPIEFGWTQWSTTTEGQGHQVHVGLSPTGLAEGTQAIQMAASSGQLAQSIISDPEWEVEFLAASEAPASGRAISFWVCHDDNESTGDGNQINLKIEDGSLYAYDNITASGWQLLGEGGEFLFSVDGDDDGKLESVVDTLNVHTIKIVGDYTTDPSYDVFISLANSDTLIQIADDVSYFQTTAPTPGSGPASVGFSPYRHKADAVIDQFVFTSIVEDLIPGDANNDGKVDGSDVTILANNWQRGVSGTNDAIWEMGDFNGDGKVDGSDVTILANNWQYGVSSSAASVPEPATWILLLGVLAALGFVRRK